MFKGPGESWCVIRKAPNDAPLYPLDAQLNRLIAIIRAKVEHPFRVVKRQFGKGKPRYRILAKNRAHPVTLVAFGNLYLIRCRLTG